MARARQARDQTAADEAGRTGDQHGLREQAIFRQGPQRARWSFAPAVSTR